MLNSILREEKVNLWIDSGLNRKNSGLRRLLYIDYFKIEFDKEFDKDKLELFTKIIGIKKLCDAELLETLIKPVGINY